MTVVKHYINNVENILIECVKPYDNELFIDLKSSRQLVRQTEILIMTYVVSVMFTMFSIFSIGFDLISPSKLVVPVACIYLYIRHSHNQFNEIRQNIYSLSQDE